MIVSVTTARSPSASIAGAASASSVSSTNTSTSPAYRRATPSALASWPSGDEHPVRGALERLAADDRRDRRRRARPAPRAPAISVAHPRHVEDRPDRDERVRRRDDDRLGRLERLDDLGRRRRVRQPGEAQLEHVRRLALVDEVLLELEPAVRGADLGRDRLVGHRQDPGGDPERRLRVEAGIRDAGAGADPCGPGDVQREVAVAEREPGLLAVDAELVHDDLRVALDAPAPLDLLDAREVVQRRCRGRA